MAEPETKAALLARIAGEHKQLEQTLDRIPTAQLVEPRLQSGWSVKDVLAHITWWERRMVQLVQGALQGQSTSPLTLPGEQQPTTVDQINLQIFNDNRERPVEEIIAERQSSYGQVIALVEALPEATLADPTDLEVVLGRPLIPLIAGDTYEHYREHNDTIMAWLAETMPSPGAGADTGQACS